ncbi:MAG: DUF3136 domain-containing protein [Synechococcaceae cyanobacterium]|nr:DUF3136 domain-containing protein [Synechococcaceae cyanobacterium]
MPQVPTSPLAKGQESEQGRPPSIGELEAKYSLYCKAMRLLLKEGRSRDAIQRTVCWSRLEQLHICLPSRYKSPDYLYAVLKRDLA